MRSSRAPGRGLIGRNNSTGTVNASTMRDQQLAEYIRRNLLNDPGRAIANDEPLITSGLMDSFSIMEVLAFIEEEWGVYIPDQEATAKQFDTVDKIMSVVARFEG